MSTATGTADSPHFDRVIENGGTSVTASNGWRPNELSAIDGCGEVDIATRRSDGTLGAARKVWIVPHGRALYVRSVNGATAAWYRGVRTCHEGELSAGRLHRGVVFVEAGTHAGEGSELDDALDAAYRGKYGRSSGAVARIIADVARATTLRVEPA
jgi:hypothetical protein